MIQFILFFFLASCASWDFTWARVVKLEPGKGGVIALSSQDDPRAREKARAMMLENCKNKEAEIAEETESVVGTRSEDYGPRHGRFGQPNLSRTSEVTEWRIRYICK